MDELAPRDQVALAIEAELERSGERAVGLDMRAVDLARFPNIAAALEEVGIDPARDLVPGRAGGALHDGRRRRRPRRALLAARPLRGRRVRLHRAARRQPARLELAGRVLRVRTPRRARRLREPRSLAADGRDRRAPRAASHATRPARRSGATPACSATPTACASCSDDPFPARPPIAASCLAREESRGAHQRTRPPGHRPGPRRHAYPGVAGTSSRASSYGNEHRTRRCTSCSARPWPHSPPGWR